MWLIFNYKDMYEGLTSNVRTLKHGELHRILIDLKKTYDGSSVNRIVIEDLGKESCSCGSYSTIKTCMRD